MKKGKIRIIMGTILILLQLLSIIGNLKAGIGFKLSFDNIYIFLYDLGVLFFYLLVGIIGVVLLIWGIVVYRKRSNYKKDNQHINEIVNNKPQLIKQKYCSKCGKLIDNNTKKCTGCDKQYFRGLKLKINKFYSVISIFVVLIVLLIALIIAQYNNINELEVQASNQKSIIEKMEKEIDEFSQEKNVVKSKETTSKVEVDENYTSVYIGEFSSILDLKEEQQRNPDKFKKSVKVTVMGRIVRTKSNSIFLVQSANDNGMKDYSGLLAISKAEKQGVTDDYIKKNVDCYCRVYMVDDTKNRVLTGDKVKITGVYKHSTSTLSKCTYELISE